MATVGQGYLLGRQTQESSVNPAAPAANAPNVSTPANDTGGVDLRQVIAANGGQSTSYVLIFTGAAATLTGLILWGYSAWDDRWHRIGVLPDIIIPHANQAADTLVNALGVYERGYVSGTGTFAVTFAPTSITGA